MKLLFYFLIVSIIIKLSCSNPVQPDSLDSNKLLSSANNASFWSVSVESVQEYFDGVETVFQDVYKEAKSKYQDFSSQLGQNYNETLSLLLDIKSDLKEKLNFDQR